MTLFVLGIVLLHAVPVFLVGAITNSQILLALAAIISGAIGIATGNPAYTFADLIGVAIAYAIGVSYVRAHKPATSVPINPPPIKAISSHGSDSELHFLHVIGLCGVGGWIRAVDMIRIGGSDSRAVSFFERLTDTWFLGYAAAPAAALCAAACLGWLIAKCIEPLKLYASWVALTLAVGLFLALTAGAEFVDRKQAISNHSSISQPVPQFAKIQQPPPQLTNNAPLAPSAQGAQQLAPIRTAPTASAKTTMPDSDRRTVIAARLYALETELNSSSSKAMGEHLTLINASLNGDSLSILLLINNYKAADADAQIALSNFNRDITRYYCGSDPYRELINHGAKLVIQLYGKDSGSIGSYPINIASCKS